MPVVPFLTAYFHSRLLLQLTQLQQSSFALENNLKCQKEIDDKVAQFGLNENSLLQVTKVRECCLRVCSPGPRGGMWASSCLQVPDSPLG